MKLSTPCTTTHVIGYATHYTKQGRRQAPQQQRLASSSVHKHKQLLLAGRSSAPTTAAAGAAAAVGQPLALADVDPVSQWRVTGALLQELAEGASACAGWCAQALLLALPQQQQLPHECSAALRSLLVLPPRLQPPLLPTKGGLPLPPIGGGADGGRAEGGTAGEREQSVVEGYEVWHSTTLCCTC
jgi:hypothetical protein